MDTLNQQDDTSEESFALHNSTTLRVGDNVDLSQFSISAIDDEVFDTLQIDGRADAESLFNSTLIDVLPPFSSTPIRGERSRRASTPIEDERPQGAGSILNCAFSAAPPSSSRARSRIVSTSVGNERTQGAESTLNLAFVTSSSRARPRRVSTPVGDERAQGAESILNIAFHVTASSSKKRSRASSLTEDGQLQGVAPRSKRRKLDSGSLPDTSIENPHILRNYQDRSMI